MPSLIRLGCRVSACVGPLQPISDGRKSSQGGGKLRRQRSRFFGTVIRSVEGRMWTVLWDSIQKCSDHSFNSLRFEREGIENVLDDINVQTILESSYVVGGQRGIDNYLAEWQPPATPLPATVNPSQAPAPSQSTTVASLPTATTNTHPEIIRTPPPAVDTASLSDDEQLEIPREQLLPTPHSREWFVAQAAATAAATAVAASAVTTTTGATAANAVTAEEEEGQEAHETDPDAELSEENFDPNELARDLAEEDHDGRHRARWNQYLQDKHQLLLEQL